MSFVTTLSGAKGSTDFSNPSTPSSNVYDAAMASKDPSWLKSNAAMLG